MFEMMMQSAVSPQECPPVARDGGIAIEQVRPEIGLCIEEFYFEVANALTEPDDGLPDAPALLVVQQQASAYNARKWFARKEAAARTMRSHSFDGESITLAAENPEVKPHEGETTE